MICRVIACLFVAFCHPAIAQDVVIIGEIHDNPHHHAMQARIVGDVAPRAIVFEMLLPEQAEQISPELYNDPVQMADSIGWDKQGWPDFAMYFPIFTSAPDAQIFGAAVPKSQIPDVNAPDLAAKFAQSVYLFGRDKPVDPAEQRARESLQKAAHCDALPDSMLPYMVNVQRMRDAALAMAIIQATYETDGLVVVITGNGHARRDWGVPDYLAEWSPDLTVHVIGQTEDNAPLEGGYDEVISSPAVDRPDPCDVFR